MMIIIGIKALNFKQHRSLIKAGRDLEFEVEAQLRGPGSFHPF